MVGRSTPSALSLLSLLWFEFCADAYTCCAIPIHASSSSIHVVAFDQQAHVLCATTVLDQDLKFSLLVAPCASPATIKFEIQVDGCPWDYSISAGDDGSVDIPGLSFGIGPLTAGAVLDYTLSGNAEALEIKLGIDACAQVFGVKECGSDITSELPLNILDEKINFGACAALARPRPHLAFLRV